MRRFSFSERLTALITRGLIGVVMAFSCAPNCRAALIGWNEYKVAEISEAFFFKYVCVGYYSVQMKYQPTDQKSSHFLNSTSAIENIAVKFSLPREKCGRASGLGDRFSHIVTLTTHVVDGLSQPKGLSPKYSSLEEKNQSGDDAYPNSPPVGRRIAELLGLFVAGVALVCLSVEYIELANKKLRVALFSVGLFIEAIGLWLWLVTFLCPESWGWPV